MSFYNNNDFPQGQSFSNQSNSNSTSRSSSSHSSPLQRTESNPGSYSSINVVENRSSNLGFLEDFVHNNNYPGPSAQNMSQLFSNVPSPTDYLPTNSNSREDSRTTYQQLPNLSLSGSSDGTALYKGINNAFDWNDGSSYTRAGRQAPSNQQWQHPSNSSFNPNEFNSSRSDGWNNTYQRAQLDQQPIWPSNGNQSSLISGQVQAAEEEAIIAQAEEISKRFKPDEANAATPSKSQDKIFKPAPSEQSSTIAAKKPKGKPTKAAEASSSSSSSSSNPVVKKEEPVAKPALPESPQKVTTTKKRKFTPAAAPTCAETEFEDESGSGSGRSRYPCLHAGCDKTFSTSGHRARHHRIHTGIKPYRCTFPDCGACFSRQDNGLQHFRTHKVSSKSEQDDTNDGGMSDNSRAKMVESALEQGTAIEIVKGNQESRVERRPQSSAVSPAKSRSRKTAAAAAKPSKPEASKSSSSSNDRGAKRIKMEKTPSLDPSTDSTASSASEASSSSGSRSTHTRNTRRSMKARQADAELPMLSVSLSSPSYTNASSNGFSSSSGSLSNGSSASASSSNPSTLVSPVSQQHDQREKQLHYSDSLRQQMMMMPMYGNGSMMEGTESMTPRTSIGSINGSMEGKPSIYDGMTPGTQDAARQNSFSDAFRGAFPQVVTPDPARPR